MVLKIAYNEASYAAKVVLKDTSVPGTNKTMAEHEISIMRKFDSHKGLVNLKEFYDNNMLYPGSPKILVLDLLVGGELFDNIVKRQKYTEKDAKNCSVQMLEAVQFLHSKKIIHRDLKPENVFMYNEEIVKIGDFGLAVIENEKGYAKGFAGTPEYAPPECVNRASTYTNKFDIWSMGVIIYILLTGHPPFTVNNRYYPEKVYWAPKTWFNNPEKHRTFANAQNLIRNMVTLKEDRFSADECLEHEWLQGVNNISDGSDGEMFDEDLGAGVMKGLREIIARNTIKKMNVIADFVTKFQDAFPE